MKLGRDCGDLAVWRDATYESLPTKNDSVYSHINYTIIMTVFVYTDQGRFAARTMIVVLRTATDGLARSLGLGKDAIQRKDRIASDRTQRRLR